jgi:acetylornithine deacetylase
VEQLTKTLVDWIEIESITGSEADYGDALGRALEGKGLSVERQEVEPGRFNILARAGMPEVVFCTHLDTVPPFFGSREDSDFVYGRGSCDAKGQAVAMLSAAQRLLDSGEDRIGFLFTVGEETDSAGAAFANAHLADPWRPRHVIIGEPTDGLFVRGHKGIFGGCLVGHGQAGHSSQEMGPSAIHELVASTGKLLDADWGEHESLGQGTVNVGHFHGGIAPNVVADSAKAQILIRTVEDPATVEARIRGCLSEHVALEGAFGYSPVEFHVPDGEESVAVAFGTDAPHMPDWGTPLLFGAGSIRDAHTDNEKVGKQELIACSLRHEQTVRELLG